MKKGLAEIKAHWAKLLQESGFRDIEDPNGDLKSYSSKITSNYDPFRADYYRLATLFLATHKFRSQIDRQIWAFHAEGLSSREISGALKGVGIKRSHTTVTKRIKIYEQTMLSRKEK